MKPVVAIICDTTEKGGHIYHQTGDKYIQALIRCADVTPILIPALKDQPIEIETILTIADGVMLTGWYSNIERHHYGLDPAPEGEYEDAARDANSLPLVRALIEKQIPLLGICRGLQEMNVALGGSLYPRLHESDGRKDHRAKDEDPLNVQYGPAHSISVVEGGLLETIVDEKNFMVNSIHGQGINKIAPPLRAEAFAQDGTIEAISLKNHPFALAVQWHPEWKAWDNKQSSEIFKAFGNACQSQQNKKRNDQP